MKQIWFVGAVTNIIPGTSGLRDVYTPNDSRDYNDALEACDNAAAVAGAVMALDGTTKAMGAQL